MAPGSNDSAKPAPVLLSTSEPIFPAVLSARASASTSTPKLAIASTSTKSVTASDGGFLGISEARTWRPKLTIKNKNYPRVTCPGTFFIQHSGGFQLIHRAKNKCLGFYSQATIKDLEKQYGKKKRTRNRDRA